MVLVVEDDPVIAEALTLSLTQEGYTVRTAPTKAKALQLLDGPEGRQIRICLLDVMLPDGTGYEICTHIRKTSTMPILFLTACDDEVHTVLGLEQGADDYIAKPFHIRELMARMKAVLRRTQGSGQMSGPGQQSGSGQVNGPGQTSGSGQSAVREPEQTISYVGDNRIDLQSARVFRGGEEIFLTAMEYRLLLIFLRNRGRLLMRQQLLDILWDDVGDFVNDNTLTVYVRRLRNKLADPEGRQIETVRGIGYRLRQEAADSHVDTTDSGEETT